MSRPFVSEVYVVGWFNLIRTLYCVVCIVHDDIFWDDSYKTLVFQFALGKMSLKMLKSKEHKYNY